MATYGEQIASAARALAGVPFRLHGRSAATGVDCIGLVALALERAGCAVQADIPACYGVRGGRADAFAAGLEAAGLGRVQTPEAGDVLLVRAGVAQWHLMIAVPGGHVHAHAGLGRVVEMPGPSPWPIESCWRRVN